MSDTVIKVENLSKQYRLGQVGTGSLSHDINRAWHKLRGKEDPYLKIGEENDRTSKGSSDYVWALRDINFEVKHGEVLGIIGRNGAGKSTLLKILSRTTKPTTGSIKIKGRVASLLEVGTGFHPELSGRDNIFLNGAILGMTKQEIKSKFDEIVDFAGVEKYIDTPVKRYSSGMYVRLAFAVAAHLEPEILIVDEVLAVGDAEFQKKALGKMKDVSNNDGRTVLFVSHNMLAIENLCNEVLILSKGSVMGIAKSADSVRSYLRLDQKGRKFREFEGSEGIICPEIKILKASVITDHEKIFRSDLIQLKITYEVRLKEPFFLNLILRHIGGDIVFESPSEILNLPECIATTSFSIPQNLLNSDAFSIQINFATENVRILGYIMNIVDFEIEDEKVVENSFGKSSGYVRPEIKNTTQVQTYFNTI